LFTELDILDFQCDICELAKSHRKPYFLSFNKSSEPFMVIHFDIWGFAAIPFMAKTCYFITFIDEYTRMT
jgi:histone deacetylase 1/2